MQKTECHPVLCPTLAGNTEFGALLKIRHGFATIAPANRQRRHDSRDATRVVGVAMADYQCIETLYIEML
jgi:hypothetical protein